MRKLSFFLLPALFLAGCAQEKTLPEPKTDEVGETQIFTVDELKFLSTVGKETKFEQEEIDRIVGDVVGFLEMTSPSTRSSGRTVSRITPLSVALGDPATRTDGDPIEEELFYAVDFGNDEGFALIAADRRLPDEVLINVGHGSFPEGEIENPGFALMMVGAEEYARREIAEYERWADSIKTVLNDKLIAVLENGYNISTRIELEPTYEARCSTGITRKTYGEWMTPTRIAPMIPVEWGQTAPFNAKASQELGKQVYTGCVATASIQLMAYWKKPETFHGQSIDWVTTRTHRTAAAISEDAGATIRNTLADVFWNLGEDVNMDWGEIGVEGSSATSQVAINVLAANGFTTTTKRNYSYNPVISSLQNSRPVYMRGNSHKTEHKFLGINWWSTYKGGHAWLIDGYLKQQATVTTETETFCEVLDARGNVIDSYSQTYRSTGTESREFFHNNFGWNGTSNGYYTTGVFDSNNGADLPSNTRSDVDGDFIYELEMWTDIR